MNNDSKYDICFLSISDVKSDARTLNLARFLAKQGKTVAIISYGSEKDRINLKNENIDFFRVMETPVDRAYKKWLHFKRFVKANFDIRASAYWASDLFSLSSAISLSKTYKAKLYYDSREIYSTVGSLSNKSLKQFVQTQLELHWIKKVDKIIVSGELDAEYLKKHFKRKIPFHVIYNLPPYREPVEADLFRKNYNIGKEDKIILYQGMLMDGRGILPVIRALKYLDNIVFCLLGTGNFNENILAEAERNNVQDRVFLCGNVDYDELHKWTCSADIGNCFIEPITFGNSLALPNKLFEYCLAGIPSIVSDLPAMKKIIDEHKFGKVIPTDSSPEKIAEAIKSILLIENYRKFVDACKVASKVFCYESQESKINVLFNLSK
ncbi:MAG: glycosyltransferase [bacterium]